MNTNGMFPNLIAESLYSLLNQSEQPEILIVCTHPNGLQLNRSYKNVKIININPLKSFPHQLIYAISNVDTDYWCVVDSDDYITPNHIKNFVSAIKTLPKIDNPHCIRAAKAVFSYRGIIIHKSINLWWTKVFSRIDSKTLNTLQREADLYHKQHMFDGMITKKFQKLSDLSKEYSYVYRLGEGYHISKSYARNNEVVEIDGPIIPRKNISFSRIDDFGDTMFKWADWKFLMSIMPYLKDVLTYEYYGKKDYCLEKFLKAYGMKESMYNIDNNKCLYICTDGTGVNTTNMKYGIFSNSIFRRNRIQPFKMSRKSQIGFLNK